jgi:hypothetical protein
MPGLVRAATPSLRNQIKDVDGRDKPGHDGHPTRFSMNTLSGSGL